jgi:hypothetical protein
MRCPPGTSMTGQRGLSPLFGGALFHGRLKQRDSAPAFPLPMLDLLRGVTTGGDPRAGGAVPPVRGPVDGRRHGRPATGAHHHHSFHMAAPRADPHRPGPVPLHPHGPAASRTSGRPDPEGAHDRRFRRRLGVLGDPGPDLLRSRAGHAEQAGGPRTGLIGKVRHDARVTGPSRWRPGIGVPPPHEAATAVGARSRVSIQDRHEATGPVHPRPRGPGGARRRPSRNPRRGDHAPATACGVAVRVRMRTLGARRTMEGFLGVCPRCGRMGGSRKRLADSRRARHPS